MKALGGCLWGIVYGVIVRVLAMFAFIAITGILCYIAIFAGGN